MQALPLAIAGLLGAAAGTLYASAEQFSIAEQFFLDDSSSEIQTGTTADGETRFEIRSGYAIVQGDIVLGKVLNQGGQTLVSRGIGRNHKLDRWIDGIVYYEISSGLDADGIRKVDEAVQHWNEYSSLTLVERSGTLKTTQPDYILFEPSSGCASWVGKIGGEQALWVGASCTTGSVIHEIGHAVGLFHEHTRTDRDNYINVEWSNIVQGKDFNFDIMDVGADDLGPYDYQSVMHYGSTFFSSTGQPTITVPDGTEIGQRIALSQIDLESVNALYDTDLMLSASANDFDNVTQLVITINNIGNNGANTLELTFPQSQGSGLQSFSGAGWNCTNQPSEVSCSLPQLADNEQSVIVLEMAAGSVDRNDVQAWISSKSFDSDLSNNGAEPENYQPAGVRSAFGDDDDAEDTTTSDPLESEQTETTDTTPPPLTTPDTTNTNFVVPTDTSDNVDSDSSSTSDEAQDGSSDNEQQLAQALPGQSEVQNSPLELDIETGGAGALWSLLVSLLFFRRLRAR